VGTVPVKGRGEQVTIYRPPDPPFGNAWRDTDRDQGVSEAPQHWHHDATVDCGFNHCGCTSAPSGQKLCALLPGAKVH
jgi:hypothetical protein